LSQGVEDGGDVLAGGGEQVLVAGWVPRVLTALDEPGVSELAQAEREGFPGAPVLTWMSLNRWTPKLSSRSTSSVHRSPTTSSASAMEQILGAPRFVGSLFMV
jgi:hypothetical protein